MGRRIGIDLGTTNSVVATLGAGGQKILQNRESETQTRSAVGLYKGDFLVGSAAIRRWPLAPKDTIISIKRLMGRAVSDPEVEKVKHWALYEIVEPSDGTRDSVRVKLAGKECSPVELSAMILGKLKSDAEYVLGEEVTHAVITVPAYFSDKQRHATREAGLKAGLTVMKILDEPTAAAIAFGIDSKEQEAKTILVYDLGGGTFDISVLMIAAGAFAPLNLEGDMWLGGDNFDQVIVDDVVSQVKREYSVDPTKNMRFMATLKSEAQKAKESLTSARAAPVLIPGVLQDDSGNLIDVDTEITRERFEGLIKPLVDRTVSLVKRAVENANLAVEDIDYVLMAGNSSAIPKVQEAMENLFGKDKVKRSVHPKHCVAVGAAITAAMYGAVNCPKCNHNNDLEAKQCEQCGAPLLASIERKQCLSCGHENVKDAPRCEGCGHPFIELVGIGGGIAPFHYGIQTAGDKFHVFINKGDQYETPDDRRTVQTFYTRFPNQRMISVPVYGGDHTDQATKNEKQGEVFTILPPGCPEGAGVKIKLWLNKDGEFQVDTFLDDGRDLPDLILRGDVDQKAVDILAEAEEEMAKKEDLLAPEERERVEEARDKVFKKMEQKDFESAVKLAGEYKQAINEAGKDSDPVMTMAYGVMAYAQHIVNRYGWLIGQYAQGLNTLSAQLQGAIEKNDRVMIEDRANKLGDEIQRLMQATDRTGEVVPTMLGWFIAFHGAIASVIQPIDPANAQILLDELEDIERAYERRSPNADARFNSYAEKLTNALEKAGEMRPEGVRCPSCGASNRLGARYCAACKADLWILGHDQTKGSTASRPAGR
jgi:molecular chaperone DnaK